MIYVSSDVLGWLTAFAQLSNHGRLINCCSTCEFGFVTRVYQCIRFAVKRYLIHVQTPPRAGSRICVTGMEWERSSTVWAQHHSRCSCKAARWVGLHTLFKCSPPTNRTAPCANASLLNVQIKGNSGSKIILHLCITVVCIMWSSVQNT